MSGLQPDSLALIFRRIAHPPVREARFWIVQVMVVGLAVFHLVIDVISATPNAVPAGIPVALLLVPISYTALRYGLSGSAATAIWAALLWLPDLLLPRDQGHVGNDLIELALVIAVAIFVGYHIDAEQLARASAQRARSEQRVAEARYRQLFETNAAPILVTSQAGTIVDANPAACALVRGTVIGRPVRDVLAIEAGAVADGAGRVIPVSAPGAGLRHYRVTGTQVAAESAGEPIIQLVLEDLTEERAEGNRVHRFAELLLKVQEEERRRIAHELHDEPLQLLVHLARSLEQLEDLPPTAGPVVDGLVEARRETLDIAARLRTVVAGLRPPALEQLGLAAALRGFVAAIAEATAIRTEMRVTGTEVRLDPGIELAAFRIAQEAVNNVVLHAGAGQLLLTLAFGADGKICLRVADNGCGFDPATLDGQLPAGRLGLLGMRERAALAGGRLTVQSAAGHGTTIEATFGHPGMR
jgi:two-component system sensor histidine kinase UhpB